MILIVVTVAAALGGAALTTLAFVVAAIRHEPRSTEPGMWAPSPMASATRRLTGLHVLRPDPATDDASWRDEGW